MRWTIRPYTTHVLRGEVELVRGLLEAGIGPNSYPFTEDETDEPPLIWVITADTLDTDTKIAVASLLLEFGADVGEREALAFAMQSSDKAFANYLRDATQR